MHLRFRRHLVAVLMALLIPSICLADLQWETKSNIPFSEAPLDMAVSRDGQWLYLLLESGKLQIYTYQHILKGTIDIGAGFDRVEAGPISDEVYLLSSKDKKIRIIELTPDQKVETTGSPFKGAADAPVVIAEFTDFQCPYCAKLGDIFAELLKLYPGKIKIVYKSYPLKSHRYAWKAAVAAMAAHQKGQFWKFHDRLFEHYKELDDEKIMEIRKEFGFDTPEFDALMRRPEVRLQVAKDRNEGQRIGVKGTPTVFINGIRLKDKTLKGFQKAIETALKETR